MTLIPPCSSWRDLMARRRSRDSRSSLPALTHTLPHCTSIGNSFLCSALMLSVLCTCSFKDNSKEVSQAKMYFYSWSLGIALGSGWKAEHWVDPTCPATQTLVRFPNLHYFQVIWRIWPPRPQMGKHTAANASASVWCSATNAPAQSNALQHLTKYNAGQCNKCPSALQSSKCS